MLRSLSIGITLKKNPLARLLNRHISQQDYHFKNALEKTFGEIATKSAVSIVHDQS